METQEITSITVRTTIDSPIERVWKLWTNPEDIVQWSFATNDWHSPRAVNDVRTGGKFNVRMEARDGSSGFDFEGIYDEVILYRRISYTIGDGRKVGVDFHFVNGRTEIIETFEAENVNSVEMQREGWQAILNNFRNYVLLKQQSPESLVQATNIAPCLWFDHEAEEAVNFYISVFKNSSIDSISYYSKEGFDVHGMEAGTVMTVGFHLNGMALTALNGGPIFKFTEAISLQVFCETQEEVDYYWNALSEGGEKSVCGWLKDKYGLSWQVVPTVLSALMSDPVRAENVTRALMQMTKLNIEELVNA